MCLLIKRNSIRYATEDIVCYKAVKNAKETVDVYESPFMNFKYQIGKTYSSPLNHLALIENPDANNRDLLYSWERTKYLNCIYSDKIEEGLHTFVDPLDCYLSFPQYTILKCIIPKGSWYYKGVFQAFGPKQSYASDTLRICSKYKKIVLYKK